MPLNCLHKRKVWSHLPTFPLNTTAVKNPYRLQAGNSLNSAVTTENFLICLINNVSCEHDNTFWPDLQIISRIYVTCCRPVSRHIHSTHALVSRIVPSTNNKRDVYRTTSRSFISTNLLHWIGFSTNLIRLSACKILPATTIGHIRMLDSTTSIRDDSKVAALYHSVKPP